MQIDLSRLEAKELLRNLGDDCDEEVRAKIEAVAGATVQSQLTGRTPSIETTATTRARLLASEFTPTTNGTAIHQFKLEDFKEWNAKIQNAINNAPDDESKAQLYAMLWTQQEIDRVNADTQLVADTQAKLAKGIPFTLHESQLPRIKPNAQIERVPVGSKNQVGDTCKLIDQNGNSVFECPEGHGYADDQAGSRGCPRCFLAGGGGAGGEATASAPPKDRDRIPGEESNW